MSSAAASTAESPITKAEFARRVNVTPGRVSQYLAEGKIFGAAIVGAGRNAQILASVAISQLREKLDVIQMAGNGLSTRLDPVPAAAAAINVAQALPPVQPPSAPEIAPRADSIEEQIKQERLETLRRQNRNAAIEDAARAGQITDAGTAQAEMRRIVAQAINLCEGGLPEMATAIAARWSLPQRDVLHLLRGEFRKVRANAAQALRREAETMSETSVMEIEGEDSEVAASAAAIMVEAAESC